MISHKYLMLGALAISLSSCGGNKSSEKVEEPMTDMSFSESPAEEVVAPLTEADVQAQTQAQAASEPKNEADSFYDDIDFDWRGEISHEIYDDYTYDQLMSDAEIDKIIADCKKHYYQEKKVKQLLDKDSDSFTATDYKETIEQLKYASIFELLWARADLEIEHMRSTGQKAADDYSKPKTKCQEAYRKAGKFANHSVMDVINNSARLISILRYADLDLENKKAFYEAKKIRAYYGKVIEVRNDLYKERTAKD